MLYRSHNNDLTFYFFDIHVHSANNSQVNLLDLTSIKAEKAREREAEGQYSNGAMMEEGEREREIDREEVVNIVRSEELFPNEFVKGVELNPAMQPIPVTAKKQEMHAAMKTHPQHRYVLTYLIQLICYTILCLLSIYLSVSSNHI